MVQGKIPGPSFAFQLVSICCVSFVTICTVEPVAEYTPFAFSDSSQGKSGRKKCQPVKIAFISSLDSPKETKGGGETQTE